MISFVSREHFLTSYCTKLALQATLHNKRSKPLKGNKENKTSKIKKRSSNRLDLKNI